MANQKILLEEIFWGMESIDDVIDELLAAKAEYSEKYGSLSVTIKTDSRHLGSCIAIYGNSVNVDDEYAQYLKLKAKYEILDVTPSKDLWHT